MGDPFASWPLALLGPRLDLQHESTTMQWDVPTPYEGDTATMFVKTDNLGGNGYVEFALQQLVDGGFWSTVAIVGLDATAGNPVSGSLEVVANAQAGQTLEYRVVVLVDGVEMDRHTVDSLFIKEETVRDGAALSQQLSTDVFSVTLFIIALVSVSFGMYALVMRRRMLAPPTEEDLADQTDVVAEQMDDAKDVPALDQHTTSGGEVPPPPGGLVPPPPMGATVPPPPPGAKVPPPPTAATGPDRSVPPPVPPTGLPEGWSQEQWNSYGWKYIDALAKK